MQKRVLISSIAIAVIAFIVFGFISKEPIVVNKEVALVTTEFVDFSITPKTETILKVEDLFYSIGRRLEHSITHKKLKEAKLIRDLIPNYPVNWIAEYDAVEILIISNDTETKTTSKNEVLTTEQLNVLNSVEMSDAIFLKIDYKAKNSVSNELDSREMNISIAVVPDKPAEYIGGYEQMMDYIKSGSVDKIVGKTMEDLKFTRLDFVINTTGAIEKIEVRESSGDAEVDAVLVKLLSEMPKWKPAKNLEETPVNQKLELILTYGDNC